jgi:hypothetical protein
MADTMQEVRNDFEKVKKLTYQIEKSLERGNVQEKGGGSYIDKRCEEIRQLCHKISVAVGASTP